MKRVAFPIPFTALPAGVVLAELAMASLANVRDALLPSTQALPKEGLPVSPEFAFSWVQAATGWGMWLILAWAVWRTVRLYRDAVLRQQASLNGMAILALLILSVFALPAWYLWFWAILDVLQGKLTVDFSNFSYLSSVLCQPFLLLLALSAWHAQKKHKQATYSSHKGSPVHFSSD